jgi:hypothetical protein
MASATKKNTVISNERGGIRAKAGPGHRLPIPQPIPNIASPNMSFQSIVLLFGT